MQEFGGDGRERERECVCVCVIRFFGLGCGLEEVCECGIL